MKFDITKLSLQPFTKEALDNTYEWLHDPEIQDLTLTPHFTKNDQLEWFRKLPERSDYIAKVIFAGGEMIGAWGLKNIDKEASHAEHYYYIGNKDYWGSGIGSWVMSKSIEACREINLSRITATIFVKNFRIVNLHFKEGFRINKYQNEMYFMEKSLLTF